MRANEYAAEIHHRMCDDDRYGYSWDERWGAYPETWEVGEREFEVQIGDYDCSSSTITAWRLVLVGTPFEGLLDGATYTGNMLSVFLASGLFERCPVEESQPGDLYLNFSSHVAMAQPEGLSEFSINEHGGVYGGQRGDQTGWEAHVTRYYNYPWNCVLHYNGLADEYMEASDDEVKPIDNLGGEVHRLYNPFTGRHHFTLSAGERDQLVNIGWVYEGVAWSASKGAVYPVFRMYDKTSGDHLLTADKGEAEALQQQGWRWEAVPFFAQDAGVGTPVYRAYNPNGGEHFYTASESELNALVKLGWQYEGGFTV